MKYRNIDLFCFISVLTMFVCMAINLIGCAPAKGNGGASAEFIGPAKGIPETECFAIRNDTGEVVGGNCVVR